METGDSSRLTLATVCQEARLHDIGARARRLRACAAGRSPELEGQRF